MWCYVSSASHFIQMYSGIMCFYFISHHLTSGLFLQLHFLTLELWFSHKHPVIYTWKAQIEYGVSMSSRVDMTYWQTIFWQYKLDKQRKNKETLLISKVCMGIAVHMAESKRKEAAGERWTAQRDVLQGSACWGCSLPAGGCWLVPVFSTGVNQSTAVLICPLGEQEPWSQELRNHQHHV